MHFDTIADMQVNHTPQSGITDLLGYHAIGDGGGGRFIWDTSFSSGDITYDAFHGIHVPVDGDPEDENGKKGVYVRVGYDTLDIRYFGAIEDEDITARLQSALDLSSDSLGSPPTPLGSSTSILNTGAGNTIIIPWPKSPYLLSSTSNAPNFIEIPNHIVLKGIGGPSGAPTGVTNIGWQFEYYGDDAAFRNKVGHADEGQSQGIFIDNIGVKIIADGATGFRFWRARDCGMSRCVSRLSNSNQTGFHFKGERGLAPDGVTLGSFTGVYDCLFERLTSSVLGVKDKTSVHFKVSGEFNNGQVNSCAFNKLRSSGRGTGLQMQAGFANVFTGFDAEDFTVAAIDIIQSDTIPGNSIEGKSAQDNVFTGTYLEPKDFELYNNASPPAPLAHIDNANRWNPATDYAIRETGLARRNIYNGVIFGGKATQSHVYLAANSILHYGNKSIETVGAGREGASLQLGLEAQPRIDLRPTGQVYISDGTLVPDFINWVGAPFVDLVGVPALIINQFTHNDHQEIFKPDLDNGHTIFVTMETAIQVGSPKNLVGSATGPTLLFLFRNEDPGGVSRTVNFLTQFNALQGSFPYTLPAGRSLFVSFTYDIDNNKYVQWVKEIEF